MNALPRFAIGPVVLVAAAKFAFHAALASRYGFHRDELYYLVCGRHLAAGYVDQPPLVPLVARLVEEAFGPSLVALRLVAALGGALLVVLAAAIARELGGSRRAQVLAALATAAAPILLLTNGLFQTVTFDQVAWALFALLVLRALRTRDARPWAAAGLVLGLGLLAKFTIATFAAALALGFVVTPRAHRPPARALAIAALLAALAVAPNVAWQFAHDWPTLEFTRNSNARAAAEFPPALFAGLQFLFVGLLAVPIAVLGFARLWDRGGTSAWTTRPLAIAAGLVLLGFGAAGGKPYYPAALYALLLGAGAAGFADRAERRGWKRLRTALPIAVVLGTLPTLWMMTPILPRATFVAHQDAWPHDDFAEMFGWEELASRVAAVRDSLPAEERARVAIVTDAYGEAAAIDVLGARAGLPPATSPHNAYWHWGPPDGDVLIAVVRDAKGLERAFSDVTRVGPVTNAEGVRNESSTKSIWICREPRVDVADSWPRAKDFN